MYLAAIPRIALEWGVGKDMVNLTLILWFVSFSLCMLVFGRLSDMRGRKPVLLGGLGLFVLSSFLCSTASGITMLILFRVLQGVGAAAPSAMAVAISRDRFDGYTRQRVLAYIGVIIAVMPMVSPMIGALLLKTFSWRAIFVAQGLLGLVSLAVSTGCRETLAKKASGGFFLIFSRYVRLFRNREYILTNSAMGLISGPFFGFIAFSPFAYMVHFGLSEKMFSMLFGLNALGIMLGSAACTRLTRRFGSAGLLTFGFAACLTCGLGLLLAGKMHFLAFAGFMLALTFFIGMSRPISVSLILEQVDEAYRRIAQASTRIGTPTRSPQEQAVDLLQQIYRRIEAIEGAAGRIRPVIA